MTNPVAIPSEQIIELRVLLREFDRLRARYRHVPSRDPGLETESALNEQLIDFARRVVAASEEAPK